MLYYPIISLTAVKRKSEDHSIPQHVECPATVAMGWWGEDKNHKVSFTVAIKFARSPVMTALTINGYIKAFFNKLLSKADNGKRSDTESFGNLIMLSGSLFSSIARKIPALNIHYH